MRRARTRASDTTSRLGAALLGYMLAVTLIITLLPFRFAAPAELKVLVTGNLGDVIANIVLFTPLGFFYCLARATRVSPLDALLAGAAVSAGIECAQLFESARFATLSDIAANALGAALGAYAALRVMRSPKVDGRLVGWLALELPLMGLVYLLIPLLWVNALAAGEELVRPGMAVMLGLFGALLLGGIQRHYLGYAGRAPAFATAALAALWFAAGAGPFIATHPRALLVGCAFVGCVTWLYGWRPAARPAQENRRFERALLARATPVYALYLIAVMCAPLRHGVEPWHGMLVLPAVAEAIEILRLLELIAAFTLVGYIAAEFRGRVYAEYARAARWVLAWGAALAMLTEIIRGFDAASGASLAHALLLVAAALYGGWLYYLQRAHVMRVLSAQSTSDYASSSTRRRQDTPSS